MWCNYEFFQQGSEKFQDSEKSESSQESEQSSQHSQSSEEIESSVRRGKLLDPWSRIEKFNNICGISHFHFQVAHSL